MSLTIPPSAAGLTLSQIEAMADPTQRAQGFERYVALLLERMPGLSIRASAERLDDGADLVLWNEAEASEIRILGTPLFVQCKWTSHPLEPRLIQEFAARLKERGLRTGLLVCNQPSTPQGEQLLLSLQHTGERIILLGRDELNRIEAGASLADEIGEKLRTLLLGP